MLDSVRNAEDTDLENLLALIEDYHDFNPGDVPVIDRLSSPLDFSKQVSKGLPCVWWIDAAPDWQTARKWTRERLCELVSEDVEVATTPDGRADSLCALPGSSDHSKVFLQPANRNMSMKKFLDLLDANRKTDDPVYYLQSQNSNLTSTPLQNLLQDIPKNFVLGELVLGEPEAVNIWIGDERSVTSTHRDPYENMYVVLRGSKTFTLWPPVDEICMDAKMVKTGRYIYDRKTRSFSIILDEEESDQDTPLAIPWVPIDPNIPRHRLNEIHPFYQYAAPRTVTLLEGQMLYLPSGWYHHVAQECGSWDDGTKAPCIAINYWYDMDYEGEKYAMRQLISRLVQSVQTKNT